MPLVDDDEGLRAILGSARTIAVVGLSDKPWRDSYSVSAYMLGQGFRIIPVNPSIRSVFGLRSFERLESVPEKIDIVNVFRRSVFVPDIVEEAIRCGAETLWLQTGITHPDAAGRAAASGMRVVVDRCIAVAHTLLVR